MEFISLKALCLTMQLVLSPDASLSQCISEKANTFGEIFACPRCRRAQPPGPRKRPHPGFGKKEKLATGGPET